MQPFLSPSVTIALLLLKLAERRIGKRSPVDEFSIIRLPAAAAPALMFDPIESSYEITLLVYSTWRLEL